jgi:lipid-A-disaccharide synthase-like uncharacterized protein
VNLLMYLATQPQPTGEEAHGLLQGLLDWAKVDTGWELGLIVFGLFAQSLFFGRWLVQWIATERRGMSHVPELFWWMSLFGATLLFVYFLLRGEPVGLIGQSIGWTVYCRNLHLIHKHKRAQSAGQVDATPEPADPTPDLEDASSR